MISRHFLKGLPAAAAMLVLYGAPLSAAEFTVTKTEDTKDGTCDADCSLREAIDAANALPDADTITLPAGTYQLKLPNAPTDVPPFVVATDEDANVDGDLDVTAEVTIVGEGATTTIIDGNGVNLADRVFHVDPNDDGVGLTLSGVTVQGGVHSSDGGGILADARAVLRLIDSRVLGNESTGGDGGGIAVSGSASVTVSTTSVSDNKANGSGGGIACAGVLCLIADSTLSNNDALGSNGGAITLDSGSAELIDSRVLDNTSDNDGGGVYTDSGTYFRVVGSEIRGNKALGGEGGGVKANSVVSIEDSTVSDNEALDDYDGGGIHSDYYVLVRNSTVSGNRAQGSGGGIYSDGNLVVENATISGNIADTDADESCSSDRGGGGIYNAFTMTVTGSVIKNNVTQKCDGGGVFSYDNFSIAGSIIADNTAANGNGGGLYNGGCDIGLIVSTTVSGNRARGEDDDSTGNLSGDGDDAEGGGLWLGCATDVINSTIVNNQADGSGGGVVSGGDIININNSTIAFNTADANDGGLSGGEGGGLFVDNYQATILNSILAGNTDGTFGSQGSDCFVLNPSSYPSLVVTGPVLIQDVTGCEDISGFSSLVTTGDPLLDPAGLADNGGLEAGVEGAREKILTLNLQASSPAIDAGDNDTCRPDDQRLTARPQDGNDDGGARCDLGALELEAGGGATTGGDTTGGDTTGGETTGGTTGGEDGGGGCSLQASTRESGSAMLVFGGAIAGLLAWFAFRQGKATMASKLKASVFAMIALLAGGSAEAATRHVTDLGDSSPPTAGQLRFILQDGALTDGDVIVFDVDGTVTLNVANGELLVNRSVTIQGNGPDLTTIDAAGGNFRVFHINENDEDVGVVLSGLTIMGAKPAAGDGAGIFVNYQGAVTVHNSVVTANEATGGNGGGIATNSSGNYGAAIVVVDSKITLNKALGGNERGGGIQSYAGSLVINRSEISGNEAEGAGGGIYVTESGTEITDTHIINNISDSDNNGSGDGGGIANDYSAVTIVGTGDGKCLIDGNRSLDGSGGGVYSDYTTAIVNCHISNNEASGASGNGGGIFNDGDGVMQLSGVNVTVNTAGDEGGGIFNDNQIDIVNSLIDQNTAANGGGGIGGFGALTLVGSTVTKNEATNGTAGGVNATGAIIQNSIITENQALNGDGGGISVNDAVLVEGSLIAFNKAQGAGNGGGLIAPGQAFLVNTTVANNESAGDGGGVYSNDMVTLKNATIAFNTATGNGGGVLNDAAMAAINSIIAGNTAAAGADCFSDFASGNAFDSLGPNIIDDKTDCDITGAAAAVSDEDPLLVGTEAVDNGGATFTIALQEGSPALDSGDAVLCESADQRGITRPQGEGCDLGAFELEVEEGGTTGDTTGGDTTGGDTTGGTTGGDDDSGGGCSLVR